MKKLCSVPSLRGLFPFVHATHANPTKESFAHWEDKRVESSVLVSRRSGGVGTRGVEPRRCENLGNTCV